MDERMDENIKSTDEKMKIDYLELNKQNRQSILDSGKYVKFEVVVGEDNPMPYMNLEVRGVNSLTLGALYVLLNKEQEIMANEFPELVHCLPFIDAKMIKNQECLGDEEDES